MISKEYLRAQTEFELDFGTFSSRELNEELKIKLKKVPQSKTE